MNKWVCVCVYIYMCVQVHSPRCCATDYSLHQCKWFEIYVWYVCGIVHLKWKGFCVCESKLKLHTHMNTCIQYDISMRTQTTCRRAYSFFIVQVYKPYCFWNWTNFQAFNIQWGLRGKWVYTHAHVWMREG